MTKATVTVELPNGYRSRLRIDAGHPDPDDIDANRAAIATVLERLAVSYTRLASHARPQ